MSGQRVQAADVHDPLGSHGMELDNGKEAPVATHYETARKVAEQGEVAVVISQPDRLATLAFPLRASDERFVYSPNGKVRAAALLCFMEEAHRQIERELD